MKDLQALFDRLAARLQTMTADDFIRASRKALSDAAESEILGDCDGFDDDVTFDIERLNEMLIDQSSRQMPVNTTFCPVGSRGRCQTIGVFTDDELENAA